MAFDNYHFDKVNISLLGLISWRKLKGTSMLTIKLSWQTAGLQANILQICSLKLALNDKWSIGIKNCIKL